MALEEILSGAHRGGADGDAAARRSKENAARGGRELVQLPVDGVGLDGVGADGPESAETDVEGDICCADAVGRELREQLRGEVKPGRGSGDRDLAVAGGVDGLVALNIAGAFGGLAGAGDVGREGNLA